MSALATWRIVIAGLVLGVAALFVLVLIDRSLAELGVPGASSLQSVGDGAAVVSIIETWRAAGPEVLTRVGFSLGWDYLFMAIYGPTFVLGGLKTRNDCWSSPSPFYTVATIAVVLMIAGTLFDAVENALQFSLVIAGPDGGLIGPLQWITPTKWLLVSPCMLLTVIGAGFAIRDHVSARRDGSR